VPHELIQIAADDEILDLELLDEDITDGLLDDDDVGFDVMEIDTTSDFHAHRQIICNQEKERLLQEQWEVSKRCAATNKTVTWRLVEESVPTEPV
jgi:hypothetical protein